MLIWNLAKKRVDQGDVNATMLTIYYNKRHGRGLQYAVVDLDNNSAGKPKKERGLGVLMCCGLKPESHCRYAGCLRYNYGGFEGERGA